MNTTHREPERETPSTPDSRTPPNTTLQAEDVVMVSTEGVARTRKSKEQSGLEPLFRPEASTEFRARWDEVQRGFVDDPQRAVKAGDDLVTQVIQSLSESFAAQRGQLAEDLNDQERSTESLRVALRRYRAFFDRLLAI